MSMLILPITPLIIPIHRVSVHVGVANGMKKLD